MKQSIKGALFRMGFIRDLWASWRSRQQESQYRARRERYAGMPSRARAVPRAARPKAVGEIHTFAVIPMLSWHPALLPDIQELGPLTHFDFEQREKVDADFVSWRAEMNGRLLDQFRQAHALRPVDWVFAYVKGPHILSSTVRAIREEFGVPTVNMCLDDKQSWESSPVDGQRGGSVGLVDAFDLWWSSARVTIHWINAEGGHGAYLPEGCTAGMFPPEELPYRIPVSFVGAAYGRRMKMVKYLRDHGVPVETFGPGWGKDTMVSDARLIEVFRTSQISIGHGGVGYSERILNVKGRDFDIPCAGGGAYLTTFNPDLAQHFAIGREILCWHSYDDLLEQVRYWLARPEACRQMARQARQRCLREHRWLHRYQALLVKLGLLAQAPVLGVEE